MTRERAPADPGAQRAAPEGELAPVAVVELFTSEGCSSCPPADELLRELATRQRDGDGRVLTLSFHVDYWNELGWPDPFSDPEYTARQRAYARALGGSGMYTPQMIVGGRDGFVGSDRERARRSIDQALSGAASARVSLTLAEGGGAVRARYAVAGAPGGAVLQVAVVQAGVVSRVPRGENAGRTLRHENVVRAFRSVPLDGAPSGEATLPLPAGARPGELSVVAYVQRPTLEILGAAQAPIAP
jgi:hypothetical protein